MLDLTLIKKVRITTSLFVLDIIFYIFGINCLFQNSFEAYLKEYYIKVLDIKLQTLKQNVSFNRNDCIFTVVSPIFRYSIHVLMYSKLGALLHRESRLSVVRT